MRDDIKETFTEYSRMFCGILFSTLTISTWPFSTFSNCHGSFSPLERGMITIHSVEGYGEMVIGIVFGNYENPLQHFFIKLSSF